MLSTRENDKEVIGVSWRQYDNISMLSPVILRTCCYPCVAVVQGNCQERMQPHGPRRVRCTPRDSEAGDRDHINCGSLIFGIPGQVLTMDEKYNVKKTKPVVWNLTEKHAVQIFPTLRWGGVTTTRSESDMNTLGSHKLSPSFHGSSGRWRDSPQHHKVGRRQLLRHLTRGCFTQELLPGHGVGRVILRWFAQSPQLTSCTPFPTSAGRTKDQRGMQCST